MKILENSERALRIAEAPPDGLNKTFVRAGLFLTSPVMLVFVFQLFSGRGVQWGSILGTLSSVWALIGFVWMLAQFVFTGNEGYTFDREHNILAVRIKKEIHSYALDRIVDTSIETDPSDGVHRVLLRIEPDLTVPVPRAYSDDYQEHVQIEQAIRAFLGLKVEDRRSRLSAPKAQDHGQAGLPVLHSRACLYCGRSDGPMEQYAKTPRCLRCMRIQNRYDNWPGFAMAIGGFGLPIACFALFGRPEQIGILLSCLILFTTFPTGAIGAIFVARWLLNPARFGSRPAEATE